MATRRVRVLTSDHLVEMIPPTSTLGREFLTSTTYERKGDAYRIVGEYYFPSAVASCGANAYTHNCLTDERRYLCHSVPDY